MLQKRPKCQVHAQDQNWETQDQEQDFEAWN